MEELIRLHDSLLQLAKEKTGVLIHNQVEELNRIVHRENQLIKQIGEGDRRRVECVNLFLKEKGFRPDPSVTVSELNKLIVRAEDKETMRRLQADLLSKLKELKELSDLNRQLIEQSLLFIEHSLDLVLGPPENEVTYGNPQRPASDKKRTGLFDTRA